MFLADAATSSGFGVTEIIALMGAVGTLIASIIAIIKHIKAGKYVAAIEEGDALLQGTVIVIDGIKKGVTTKDSRDALSVGLKDMGKTLGCLGLKDKMDTKLKELGLDDKS